MPFARKGANLHLLALETGIYRIVGPGGESNIAINPPALPAQRVQLTAAETAPVEGEPLPPATWDMWRWLVIAAILALWLEWALYYMALVERRAGNSEAEIADFKKVVAQYPMSRDARRELGKSYYRENNAEGAIEQFEALQVLDPDDVTAHYNLSILYGRMGRDKESAEQQAMLEQMRGQMMQQGNMMQKMSGTMTNMPGMMMQSCPMMGGGNQTPATK